MIDLQTTPKPKLDKALDKRKKEKGTIGADGAWISTSTHAPWNPWEPCPLVPEVLWHRLALRVGVSEGEEPQRRGVRRRVGPVTAAMQES